MVLISINRFQNVRYKILPGAKEIDDAQEMDGCFEEFVDRSKSDVSTREIDRTGTYQIDGCIEELVAHKQTVNSR